MQYLSNINSLTSYLPELMIVLTILCVFIAESISVYRPLTYMISIGGLLFTGILLLFSHSSTSLLFEGMIINDSLSIFFKWLILLSTLSIVLISKEDNSVIS